MKLKRINFAPTVNSNPRSISALGGNRTECYVGMRVLHPQYVDEQEGQHPHEAAIVSSMELDRQAGLVFIRQVYAEGTKAGQPYRRQTCNRTCQPGEEADCIAVAYDERCVLYFDDEQPAQQQKGK